MQTTLARQFSRWSLVLIAAALTAVLATAAALADAPSASDSGEVTFTIQTISVTVEDIPFGNVHLESANEVERLKDQEQSFFRIEGMDAAAISLAFDESNESSLGGWTIVDSAPGSTPGQIALEYAAMDFVDMPAGLVSFNNMFIMPNPASATIEVSNASETQGLYGGIMTLHIGALGEGVTVNQQLSGTLTIEVTATDD